MSRRLIKIINPVITAVYNMSHRASLVCLLALLLSVNSDICEQCACSFDNKNALDYKGEYVDCSYRKKTLETNFTLPNTAYLLDLSSSKLTKVYRCSILTSKTISELKLNDNNIDEILPDALQLPELKRLDLSYNLLQHLEQELFKNIRKLEYLNLANNQFTTFEKLTFHPLSNLQAIVLDNNNIGPSLKNFNLFDRSGFGLTNKIKNISISGINLNSVPDNFFVDAYDLRTIVISNNSLKDIFELPFTIEYLDLSDNPIVEIEGEDFYDVKILKHLKLNNLAIKEIPAFAFYSLSSLTHLELERNNKLTQFSNLTFGREVLLDPVDFALESLSLKGSRLTKLDKSLLVIFGQLSHLDLQGNPWHCDCNIVWLKKLQIPEKDYDHLRCGSPLPVFNARIFDLDNKYFVCPPKKHHVGLVIAIIAVCITLGSIAVWIFVFVPSNNTRKYCIAQMHTPTAAYMMLPTPNVYGDDDL